MSGWSKFKKEFGDFALLSKMVTILHSKCLCTRSDFFRFYIAEYNTPPVQNECNFYGGNDENLKIKIIYVFVMFAQLNKDTWKLGKLCHVGLRHSSCVP